MHTIFQNKQYVTMRKFKTTQLANVWPCTQLMRHQLSLVPSPQPRTAESALEMKASVSLRALPSFSAWSLHREIPSCDSASGRQMCRPAAFRKHAFPLNPVLPSFSTGRSCRTKISSHVPLLRSKLRSATVCILGHDNWIDEHRIIERTILVIVQVHGRCVDPNNFEDMPFP